MKEQPVSPAVISLLNEQAEQTTRRKTRLDKGLEDTFPASDPVSVTNSATATGTTPPESDTGSREQLRTMRRDVENLRKAGLALGASLDNTVALGDDRVMNPEGLRYPQEFVRHKMLDALGDMALAGAPILGSYRSVKGGHRLNAYVLQKLFADAGAWTMVRAPWVREAGAVDVSAGIAAVNYAADRT